MKAFKLTARGIRRAGYEGFCRGGIRWSSSGEGTIEIVTERLLNLVKAEPMVSVMDFVEVDPGSAEVKDIPEPAYINHAARALDESKRLDAEFEAMKAQQELEAKRLRNAKLAADLAALKAEPEPKPVSKSK